MADHFRPDWGQAGRALALAGAFAVLGATVPGAALAQTAPKAEPTKPAPAKPAAGAPARPAAPPAAAPRPAPANPGGPVSVMPWAHPVVPQLAPPSMRPAQGPTPNPQAPAKITPAQLRPADRNLIDCKEAPRNAVVQTPASLARWATIYCTRQGHILTTNEGFYSAIPGTQGKLRGVIGAAALNKQTGDVGHGAYFTKIEYTPLDARVVASLTAGVDPKVLERVKDKPLVQLTLTTDKAQVYRGVVVDPDKDPFWVIPIVDGKIGQTGFYVATVDYVNKTLMQ